MPIDPLCISERAIESNVIVFTIEGQLGSHGSELLKETVQNALAAGKYRLVFDLSRVPYIASSCIGPFLFASSEAEKNGGAVVLVGLCSTVELVFESLGLIQQLKISTDLKKALAQYFA